METMATSKQEMTSSHPEVTSPRAKRVSFLDQTEKSFQKERSTVEISELFPNVTQRSILRPTNVQEGDGILRKAKRFKCKQAKEETKERKEKDVRPVLPNKRPTESLVHALLSAMTYKTARFQTRKILLPKLDLLSTHNETQGESQSERLSPCTQKSQSTVSSSRKQLPALSVRSVNLKQSSILDLHRENVLPEIIATPRNDIPGEKDALKNVPVCGLCKRTSVGKQKVKPAAGYCKFCEEFLCASCVVNHQGKLTKLHPRVVFYCGICKEMNILSQKGAGYCIKCKHFYCSSCVVTHCAETSHEVLEGKDLVDVINVLIGQ